ncbi:MAG: heme-binding protein [Acidobacteriota bacterium]
MWADNDDDKDKGKQSDSSCSKLPTYNQLKAALDAAVGAENSGLNLNMWGTIVDRDGVVCAVAFSGAERGSQWPGSRVISAQKANTANAFSLDGLALSTANLYSATQPGGSLFGLQESNPVDVDVAYKGPSTNYGKANDPMVGSKIGGVNVFGGGLALYNSLRKVIGAVGVSGDTSCADHRIGWLVRDNLNLDNLAGVGGVATLARPDNIIFDVIPNAAGGTGVSAGGFGHAKCLATDNYNQNSLPAVQ